MAKVLVINIDKCSGCYACQLACKDEHVGNDWTPYAKPQPAAGHFWMKIRETERGAIPKVKVSYMPTPCMHCDNARCIAAATGGAVYKRSDGIVIIDPVKSVGQKQLVAACPYGSIYWNSDLNIPQKCTMCAHLPDNADNTDPGLKVPRCVDTCHTGAIMFGEYDELKDLIAKAEVLHPEYGTKPRVYYLNPPKPFIAGAVVDANADECLEGAKITATDLTNGRVYTATSDEFGDFWLKQLEWNHIYSIRIESEGYHPKTIQVVSTNKDVNLGDIFLYRV